MVTKDFKPLKRGDRKPNRDAGNGSYLEAVPAALKKRPPVGQHPEMEVCTVEEALVVFGEVAEQDLEPKIQIPAVGKRRDDHTLGREMGPELLQQILWAAEVFEHVADDDYIEGTRKLRQRLFEIMHDGGRVFVETQGVFDAGDREALGSEKTRKKAIAAADVEQFGALYIRIEQPEQEHVARIGRLL